jgi:hypothetical protein
MTSTANDRFWNHYAALPDHVKDQTRAAYATFLTDPHHPSLHFKRIHSTRPIYSVRIGLHYRAVGIFNEQEITWFWIGSHAEYDRLVKQLRKS